METTPSHLFAKLTNRALVFDPVEAYEQAVNKQLVGKALHYARDQVIIATQFGFKNGRNTEGLDSRPERIRQVAENSLRHLEIDFIEKCYPASMSGLQVR
ncbi:aldo/keto reductase [Dyadobacter sandarakinus]|uniref:aldo/keto reductase n=1 Tax=Dyadobacter sandarakinus TaxID=2747268 RepID=UPI001956DC78|nr:aldo/keto reductase [Dyadobacter sandarakinus]